MALTLTQRTVNYIIKNLILSSLAFESPREGQLRYNDNSKLPAWYNGTIERDLSSLTINELSDVKDYVDGTFSKTLEFTSSETVNDYETFTHNFNNSIVECTVLRISDNYKKVFTTHEAVNPNSTKVYFGDIPNTDFKISLKALVN